MSASALARALLVSVSFFPVALALAKAWSPIKAAHHFLSGGELGGWSRGAWLLAPWARWRRRRVGGVGGRWAIDDLGPYVAEVLWSGMHCPSRLGPAEDPPLVTVCSEVPPLGECGRDAGSSEGLVERPAPRHFGAPD